MKLLITALFSLTLSAQASYAQSTFKYTNPDGEKFLLTIDNDIPECDPASAVKKPNGKLKHIEAFFDLALCTVEGRPGYLEGRMTGMGGSGVNTEVIIIVGDEYDKRLDWIERKNPMYKPLLENQDPETGYCPKNSSALMKKPNIWRQMNFTNFCLEQVL